MVDNKNITSLSRHLQKNISLMKINNIILMLFARNSVTFIRDIFFSVHVIWESFHIVHTGEVNRAGWKDTLGSFVFTKWLGIRH